MSKGRQTQGTNESAEHAKPESKEAQTESLQQDHASVFISGATGVGNSASVRERHTSLLGDRQPANAGRNALLVQHLQHLHGNAHVNRLVHSATPSSGTKAAGVQAAEAEHRAGADYPVSSGMATRIQSRQRRGQSLPSEMHQEMANTFGRSFADVRVHTDHEADQLNREVYADAFTAGQDIFFRRGHYAPHTPRGKGLLAHELAHVVHSGSPHGEQHAPMAIFRAPSGASDDWGSERDIYLDKMRAAMQEALGGMYGRWDDAYMLLLAAQTMVNKLSEAHGPRERVEVARTLLKLRSLFIVRMLDRAPKDETNLFDLRHKIEVGKGGVGEIPPFHQAATWREIVDTADEFETAEQDSSGRPRPLKLPPLPAEPEPPTSEPTPGPYDKPVVPDEVKAGVKTLKATKISVLEADLNQRSAKKDLDIHWRESDRSKKSLADRTNHIIYVGARWIFLLNKQGQVINSEKFAYDLGWVRGPGPGHYYLYHTSVGRTAGMTTAVRLEQGKAQHTTVDFQAERYVSGTIPLTQILSSDLRQGKGVMVIISQKQFMPGRKTGATWGNLARALSRSVKYMPQFLDEEIDKIRNDPTSALSNTALQLVLETAAKNIPIIKAALMALDLPDLAGWLGKMASIAIFAVSDEEIEFVAQAIARRAMEETVQGALGGVARKGVKVAKKRIGKKAPETNTPEPSQEDGQVSKPDPNAEQRSDPDAEHVESVMTYPKLMTASQALDRSVTITRQSGKDIHKAGGWRKHIEQLGPDSDAAWTLEAQRHRVVNWLQLKLGLSESDIKRTGSIKPKSDLDINFLGPRAEANIIKAKKALAARFGMSWKDVENLLDMSLLADPKRAHIYTNTRLSRKARRRLRRELEAGTQMRYLQALATRAKDTPEIRAELQRAAKEWGIDPADIAAKPSLQDITLVELRKTMDDMHILFERNPTEDLALDIMRLQIELNMRNKEAYFEPGAVRERVTREMGMAKGSITASEAYSDLLAQRAETLGKLSAAGDTEAKLKKSLEAETDAAGRRRVLIEAAGRYEFSKYAYRFLSMAQRLGLRVDKNLLNMAESIYRQKSVDGILMGKAPLETYAHQVLKVQEAVLSAAEKVLQSRSKRAKVNASLELNHQLHLLLQRLESAGQKIRENSEAINDVLVHASAVLLVNQLGRMEEKEDAQQSPSSL